MKIVLVILVYLITLTIYILSCIFCYHSTKKAYLTGKLGEPDSIDIMNVFLPIFNIIIALNYMEEWKEENDTAKKFFKIKTKH